MYKAGWLSEEEGRFMIRHPYAFARGHPRAYSHEILAELNRIADTPIIIPRPGEVSEDTEAEKDDEALEAIIEKDFIAGKVEERMSEKDSMRIELDIRD